MEVPDEGQDGPERVIQVDFQRVEGTRPVIVCLTRRRGRTDDRQSLSDTAPLQRTTVAASPKGQDGASCHPPEQGMDRQVYLHAHVQAREEETRLDLLPKKKIDTTPPGDKKTDQGKENDP